MSTLYFGYGSNLNSKDLESWLSGYKYKDVSMPTFYSKAILPGYELTFNAYSYGRGGGVLSIVPSEGSVVRGVLYQISDYRTWLALDAKEGYPICYDLKFIEVLVGGVKVSAATYVTNVDREMEGITPSKKYLEVVSEGYKECGLSVKPLFTAAEKCYL